MDDIENDRSLSNSGRSTPVHRERKLAEPSTTAQPPTTDPSRTLRLFEQQSVDRRRRALGETVRDASVDRARATGRTGASDANETAIRAIPAQPFLERSLSPRDARRDARDAGVVVERRD